MPVRRYPDNTPVSTLARGVRWRHASANGVFVNDRRINGEVEVTLDDQLHGEFFIEVERVRDSGTDNGISTAQVEPNNGMESWWSLWPPGRRRFCFLSPWSRLDASRMTFIF